MDICGVCKLITLFAVPPVACATVLLVEMPVLLPPWITGPSPRSARGIVAGAGGTGAWDGADGRVAINRSIGDGGDGQACCDGRISSIVVLLECSIKVRCHFIWLLLYMSVNFSRCSSCEVAVVGTPSAFLMVAISCCVASAM